MCVLTGACTLFVAYLHWWTWIQVPTRIPIPNPMATLYYAEHFHVVRNRNALLL